MWPVTAYSKSINYNIPEEHILPGQNQVIANLKAGSALLQLKLFLKHRKLIDGIKEPNLANFATACMVDILRKYRPGLALIHLITYDSFCHQYGKDTKELKTAYDTLNRNMALLLVAAKDEHDIIIFSDHNQINVDTVLTPNEILYKMGLLGFNGEEYLAGETGCFIECFGGSAVFHAMALTPDKIAAVRQEIMAMEGFERFLTDEELKISGYGNQTFGFSAKTGYSFEPYPTEHKATHG
jgi:predicted AlkP superfamily pyrophosphatase or phosphodiesterase